jgi:hypothetical protein
VLKTTSPRTVPDAPKLCPGQTLPSSRTRRQSDFFQGFSEETAAETTYMAGRREEGAGGGERRER